MADSCFLRALYMAACAVLMAVSAVFAQEVGAEKPLLIVRFNQPNVYYLNSLDFAVIKAKTVNPQVQFNVVSYVPAKSTTRNSESARASAIIREMRNLGVPPQQIAFGQHVDASLAYQEVHIFVE